MADISASMVKELRDKTGVGMMQCKKALQETDGDLQKAVEVLRKKGEETAAKRAGKAAKEGRIAIRIENGIACMVEVNSETDFVAKNDDFNAFTGEVLDVLLAGDCGDVETLLQKQLPSGLTVRDGLNGIIAKIGENISVRRFERIGFEAGAESVFSYIHMGGKIGVLVRIGADPAEAMSGEEFQALGKNLTLQIAASNPIAIAREEVDAQTLEKEKDIYRSRALNEGKPEKVVDKIVEGRMAKYFKEVCLLEQPFVKDGEKTIKKVMEETEKSISAKLAIKGFVRFVLGGEAA